MLTPKDKMGFALQKMRLAGKGLGALAKFALEDARRGSLWANIRSIRADGKLARDMSWAELLEERAQQIGDKTFLLYKEESFSYGRMNENANRTASFLVEHGGGRGKGMGIFMKNSPRFLDLFFAAQKIGMYVVPINSELVGDGLGYILQHSDIEFLAADAELLPVLRQLDGMPEALKTIIIDDVEEEARGIRIPKTMQKGKALVRLSQAQSHDPVNPGNGYNPNDMVLIMYTSGTTGRPKGVVYTTNTTRVKLLGIIGRILVSPNDIYYTALALCHGNAMFLTVTLAMVAGATVALSRRFSASGFWEDIRKYDVTIFNTIGSIIPILMKQPEKPMDSQNKVHTVLSAACPADLWEPFEKRFNVTIYEGYGAVDSGGKGVLNLGTAPVGSLGKPIGSGKMASYKLVDEQGNEVPTGEPGELIFWVGDAKSSVSYYKNEKATSKKVRDGWMFTGDMVRQDEDGYLYFVGRDTEHLRKGGENVSAYEVEHVIRQHPAVKEVAVYAVPSELAEDEIMAAVQPAEGENPDPGELRDYLTGRLAKFAIPRYIRLVDELPMTQTLRVIKKALEDQGVTPDTYDAMAGKR